MLTFISVQIAIVPSCENTASVSPATLAAVVDLLDGLVDAFVEHDAVGVGGAQLRHQVQPERPQRGREQVQGAAQWNVADIHRHALENAGIDFVEPGQIMDRETQRIGQRRAVSCDLTIVEA